MIFMNSGKVVQESYDTSTSTVEKVQRSTVGCCVVAVAWGWPWSWAGDRPVGILHDRPRVDVTTVDYSTIQSTVSLPNLSRRHSKEDRTIYREIGPDSLRGVKRGTALG